MKNLKLKNNGERSKIDGSSRRQKYSLEYFINTKLLYLLHLINHHLQLALSLFQVSEERSVVCFTAALYAGVMFLDRQTSNPSIMEHETVCRVRTFHSPPERKIIYLAYKDEGKPKRRNLNGFGPVFEPPPPFDVIILPANLSFPRILQQTNSNPALFSTRQRGGDPFSCDRRNCDPG